jgi:prepilin-type N-terminal cleavage/methylation domain-containing protein
MRHDGYTIIELMVTIVIVAVVASVLGVFFVKLLGIQEQEREEAYIREKLSDVCGIYADFMSVGDAFSTSTNSSNPLTAVTYRQETGGISLETGLASRVAYLTAQINNVTSNVDLNVYALEAGETNRKLSRSLNGFAHLIPIVGDMMSFTIRPLNNTWIESGTNEYKTSNSALGYIEVAAAYRIKNEDGFYETKTASVGRVVRLWNRE